jgi:hypothetical protein
MKLIIQNIVGMLNIGCYFRRTVIYYRINFLFAAICRPALMIALSSDYPWNKE